MIVRPNRVIVAVLVAFMLLSGLGNACELVLCHAADGHTEIEFAKNESCSEFLFADSNSIEGTGQRLATISSDLSHCGTCVDIPLGASNSTRQWNFILPDSKSSVKMPVAAALGFSLSPSNYVAPHCAPKAQHVNGDSLASLRAVILLV